METKQLTADKPYIMAGNAIRGHLDTCKREEAVENVTAWVLDALKILVEEQIGLLCLIGNVPAGEGNLNDWPNLELHVFVSQNQVKQ